MPFPLLVHHKGVLELDKMDFFFPFPNQKYKFCLTLLIQRIFLGKSSFAVYKYAIYCLMNLANYYQNHSLNFNIIYVADKTTDDSLHAKNTCI